MSIPSTAENSTVLACDLTAIEMEQREQHIMETKRLFSLVQEARELPDGYALRLPNDTDTILSTAGFIVQERKCCPFIHFALELEAENGPLWLRLTGRDGVKPVLQAEFGEHL
ncbi:MAG: hypothetical protein KDI79_29675 [Anaerolineae bacterium]|nr:hypothetical protein [Anaerolineae bacterium]